MRIRNATDLHLDLDRFPSRVVPDLGWIFVDGPPGCYSMENQWEVMKAGGICFGCENKPLRQPGYCGRCDHCWLDGRMEFPGLPVDYAPDPDYAAEGTIYAPDPDLAGGVGVDAKPVRVRRGVTRSRKAG